MEGGDGVASPALALSCVLTAAVPLSALTTGSIEQQIFASFFLIRSPSHPSAGTRRTRSRGVNRARSSSRLNFSKVSSAVIFLSRYNRKLTLETFLQPQQSLQQSP